MEITTSEARTGGSLLDVSVLEQPSAPFDVQIDVKDVGGPSAGLMLTLGILDLVGDDDLTDGAVVAGTGTIDAQGTVGPIGGITLKMVAAQEIGAGLFLVPADNCAEATAVVRTRVPPGQGGRPGRRAEGTSRTSRRAGPRPAADPGRRLWAPVPPRPWLARRCGDCRPVGPSWEPGGARCVVLMSWGEHAAEAPVPSK